MQSINNLKENIANTEKPRGRIYIVLFLFFIVAVGALVFTLANKKDTLVSTTGEYYDPASKETVSNTADKTPESYGEVTSQPVFLGFSKLLDVGVSADQITGAKLAFTNYFNKQNLPVKEISIYVDTIKQTPLERGSEENRSVTFNAILGRKQKVAAKLEYYDLSNIRLYLANKSGGDIIFDSGAITPNEITDDQNLGD